MSDIHTESITLSETKTADVLNRICLTPEAKQLSRREFKDSTLELFPGVYNWDPRYDNFLKNLSTDIGKIEFGGVNDLGVFEGPPLDRDPKDLRTRAGALMLPLDFPSAQRVGDITATQNDEKLARYTTRVMEVTHKKRLPSYGKFNNESSSGFPLNAHSALFKKEMTKKNMSRIEDIKKKFSSKKFEALCNDHGILFLGHTQIRTQVDKYDKVRKYTPFGNINQLKLDYPSVMTKDLKRMRTRSVMAYSNGWNYILSVLIDGMRAYRDHRFSKTWKHRGGDDIVAKIEEFAKERDIDVRKLSFFSMDFSKYDSTIPYAVAEAYVKGLGLDPIFEEMTLRLLTCPRFSSGDGVSRRPLLDGDPFVYEDMFLYRGLTSGISFTSDMGKTVAIAFQIMGLVDAGLIPGVHSEKELTDEIIEKYLDHKLVIGSLNSGDDNVAMSHDHKILMKWLEQLKSYDIFEIEIEKGTRFLGFCIYWDSNSVLRATLGPISYLSGCWQHERDIHAKMRPFAVFGLKQRRDKDLYGGHPLFDLIREIECVNFERCFGENMLKLEKNNLVSPPVKGNLDIALLRIKPELLYYTTIGDKLTDAQLEEFCFRFSDDICEEICKKYVSKELVHEIH